MSMPFSSDEARELNKKIFEAIYFAAVGGSEIAKKEGPYSTFKRFSVFQMVNCNIIFGDLMKKIY